MLDADVDDKLMQWRVECSDGWCECVRWCQQDLMPVYNAHVAGNYSAAVAEAERDLVFAGYTPTSKLWLTRHTAATILHWQLLTAFIQFNLCTSLCLSVLTTIFQVDLG